MLHACAESADNEYVTLSMTPLANPVRRSALNISYLAGLVNRAAFAQGPRRPPVPEPLGSVQFAKICYAEFFRAGILQGLRFSPRGVAQPG